MSSPFRVAVINDEVGQDFGRSCEVIAREFGLQWIELRGMWNKNLLHLDAKEVEEARRILEKYKLRVTDIASPLFQSGLAGRPEIRIQSQGCTVQRRFHLRQQRDVLRTMHRAGESVSKPTAYAASIFGGLMIRRRIVRR